MRIVFLQDAIKQNLLRSELFVKVSRTNGESGKGSCWAVHPQLVEFLEKETSAQLRDGGGGRKLKRAYSYGGKEGRQSRGGGRKRVKSEAQAPVDPCGLPGDLDWISLLNSQRVSCGSYGSPILGPPDLGQVGDPMICSPLIVPTSITSSSSPSTLPGADPALDGDLKDEKEVEDVFSDHHSPLPSPHLLRWAEGRPESPSRHPWAESRETTLRNLGQQRQTVTLPSLNRTPSTIWSPDMNGFSSSASCSTSLSLRQSKPRTAGSYIY